VKPSGKTTKLPDTFSPDLSKFRGRIKGSKLPKDSRIERKRFRIDTFAEKQQLSFFRQKKKGKKRLLEPGFIGGF